MDIAVTIIAAFVIQLGSHFFPWAQVLGVKKLHPIIAYVIGTLTNGLIFTAWLYFRRDWHMIWVFWAVIVAGGLGVIAGYAIDGWIRVRAAARENREVADLLMEQREDGR